MFLDSLEKIRNLKLIKKMEKKQYIMPSVRVKAVNMLLMAGMSTHDEVGDEGQFSKGLDLSEDNGSEGVTTHDVWED